MSERTVIIDSIALRAIGGFLPVPRALARRRDLSHAAKLTYGQLLAYGWEKDFAAPAQDRLADDLGMSERNVRYVLAELHAAQLLDWVRRGRGQSNQYVVKLPPNLAGLDRQPASGQEVDDRKPLAALERQPASGPSIGEKKKIDKDLPGSPESPPAETGTGRREPKVTWLTPYAEAWTQRFGGEMPCSKFAGPLRRTEKQLGAAEALRRWGIYLAASGTYANAANFASTIGEWVTDQLKPHRSRPSSRDTQPPAGDRFAADEARSHEQQRRLGIR